MAWTSPNVGTAAYADQAEIDQTDWDILVAGYAQNGVKTGCAVTAQVSPDMTVAVASGTIYVAGAEVAVASGNLTISAAHASLARKDIIVVNNSGTKAVTAGTAAAQPLKPSIPANSVVLAEVYVPATDTAINSNQITDKRAVIVVPTAGGGSWTLVSKAADTSRNTTATVASDPDLTFSMLANVKYRIEAKLYMTVAATGGGYRWNLTGPGSPTLVVGTFEAKNWDGHLAAVTNNASGIEQFAGTDLTVSALAASTPFVVATYDLIVHNGANTAAFAIQWAQHTSDGDNTTMRAGSYLQYMVV